MLKFLLSSPPLNYFPSHFNSGGSDANSVGERLDSVCVSPQKSGLQKHSYLTDRIGFGTRYTDVTNVGGPGNHQTFLQALKNTLECIFAGNSCPIPSMHPGSFKFNGFNFQLQHKSGAEFDLVLTIGPNHNHYLVNANKLESLSHEIRSAVLNFNSENRYSGSIQWNSASIEINPTLLVDCIGDNSVQLTQFINTLGWSVRSK